MDIAYTVLKWELNGTCFLIDIFFLLIFKISFCLISVCHCKVRSQIYNRLYG